MVSLDQFRVTFLTECEELLADMEERLVGLTPDSADNERLNAIFRCAHSIKGGSGAFGLDYITSFTHALEALLDAMREGKVAPTHEAVDVLLKSVDVVTQMVNAAKEGVTPPAELGSDILPLLKKFAGGGAEVHALPSSVVSAIPAGAQQWHIEFVPHVGLFASGNEPLLILRELSRLGKITVKANVSKVPPIDSMNPESCYLSWSIDLVTDKGEAAIREAFEFVESQCDLTVAPMIERRQRDDQSVKPVVEDHAKAGASTSIRVDLDKVDRLVNMVGELVITEAMIKAQVRELSPEQFVDLMRGVDELSQHTRELQEAVMSVRMQPVKSIFSRMPRIVRDLSSQLNKDIVLEVHGENTEVDKTVIEQLSDPLMHMIRNSCDHGIEGPDERVGNGKPAQGTIVLSAYHRGGRIVIEIRDDGAGINRGRVLAKAREKGLVSADLTPTDEEIDHMIFMAGFSTAEVVTNVSGRGVGMDVVRRNIEGMGGTVHVGNHPGQGSVFTVSLPLTLAILDGMIVRVGEEKYIIPITSIIETMRPKQDEVRHVEGASDVINVRGEFIPIIYLYEVFAVADAESNPAKALVVLVESGRDKLGVVVDELIGQQQVVIKSLETNSDPVRGISGATILGDGHVSLILEISHLKQLAEEKRITLSHVA
jgi:two-component system chemotaxis sensor kinase CheA